MRTWALAIIFALASIAPILYLVYHVKDVTSSVSPVLQQPVLATVEFIKPTSTKLEVGSVIEVRSCRVIDGYRFGLSLEGNKWIEAQLPVATKDEATNVVIDWLKNSATQTAAPTVKLLRNLGSYWIVEFRLTVNGKQEKVTDLLKAKALLLE